MVDINIHKQLTWCNISRGCFGLLALQTFGLNIVVVFYEIAQTTVTTNTEITSFIPPISNYLDYIGGYTLSENMLLPS